MVWRRGLQGSKGRTGYDHGRKDGGGGGRIGEEGWIISAGAQVRGRGRWGFEFLAIVRFGGARRVAGQSGWTARMGTGPAA